MPRRLTRGRFVHVVGLVDLDQTRGEITSVIPTDRAVERDTSVDSRIALEVQDAQQTSLYTQNAELRRNSCAPPEVENGLIQEDLPYKEGMSLILLKLHGTVVDTYKAGTPPLAPPPALGGLGPSNRMALSAGGPSTAAPGVTYTVQVQADNAGPWQTIAVGRPKPEAEVDADQFPGARRLTVRVLRSTGIAAEEVLRREIALGGGG